MKEYWMPVFGNIKNKNICRRSKPQTAYLQPNVLESEFDLLHDKEF